MSKNRHNPPPIDYKPVGKHTETEVKLVFKPCLVCGKQITEGYYGSWTEGGTCSRNCERIQEAKPRLHGGREIINGDDWL